ncbi:DUF6691 family protein [Burkholderia stagnalis]|uniref:YeeE/YedE family protein n=1 Tax=Burkholderia stagnalis TaxID=1503054 RepID=A0ABX9YJY1_9BURK|nr:DUF6691 family protein [Burkholderia stagnalis]KVN26431.1 hypothetical protein WT11_32525 [Burkholderia stagnalis]KWI31098.1 hypothetical protein WT71_11815 [Burkholderia stagnalis]KWI81903.1 hypothetical protein WT73_03460 [Burkholderia stagnalis]MDY7803373.1 DUF6691 family protein [Burkholderia stagnalis]RQQ55081.1 hypothetical protein DF145_03365 [Burkholderia stagnalis]
MATWCAFIAGLVFGGGLVVSGMANPRKVLGFLDLAGSWDPSLAFVMAGATGVGVLAFAWARRRTQSWLGLPMQLPTARAVTVRLVAGSAAFGAGWGLAGFCPGPAIVSIGFGSAKGIGFVVAMLAGMAAFEWIERRRAAR